MKADAELRISAFNQHLEKFAVRWYREGDHEVCINAMASLGKHRVKFDELLVSMEKLKYVNTTYICHLCIVYFCVYTYT